MSQTAKIQNEFGRSRAASPTHERSSEVRIAPRWVGQDADELQASIDEIAVSIGVSTRCLEWATVTKRLTTGHARTLARLQARHVDLIDLRKEVLAKQPVIAAFGRGRV